MEPIEQSIQDMKHSLGTAVQALEHRQVTMRAAALAFGAGVAAGLILALFTTILWVKIAAVVLG